MKKILNFYNFLKEKKFTTISGAIAFFFIVNGGSLLFLIALTLKLFHFEFKEYILESNDTVKSILLYFESNSLTYYKSFYFILVVTSIWSSSTLFYHLIHTGEMIYNTSRKRFPFFIRVISILFVFIFIAVILTSFIISLIGNYFITRSSNPVINILIKLLLYMILPLIIITFFMFFVPPIQMKFKNIYKGLFFTIIFWIISTIFYQLYLQIFINFKAIYGALTVIIITMIYIYLLTIGLTVGLIINMLEISKIKEDNLSTI